MKLALFTKKNVTEEFKEGMPYPTDSYLTYIIQYAIEKNHLDVNQISERSLERIILRYHRLCVVFSERYVIGKLDTFKRAACLLVAIKNRNLFYDKNENGIGKKYVPENTVVNISIDAAFKMIETPYWFIGEKSDVPYKLNTVDFDRMFQEDPTLLQGRQMLIDSITFEGKNYLSYADTLQLWHYTASIRDNIVPGLELHIEKGYEKCKTNRNN